MIIIGPRATGYPPVHGAHEPVQRKTCQIEPRINLEVRNAEAQDAARDQRSTPLGQNGLNLFPVEIFEDLAGIDQRNAVVRDEFKSAGIVYTIRIRQGPPVDIYEAGDVA